LLDDGFLRRYVTVQCLLRPTPIFPERTRRPSSQLISAHQKLNRFTTLFIDEVITVARFVNLLMLVSLIVPVAGCGGDPGAGEKVETVPLTGTLLVDGQPRGAASIQFTPMDAEGGVRTSYALTESDGSFAATTYVTGDGIVPGKYKITLGNDEDVASTDPAKMMAAAAGQSIGSSEINVPADGLTGIEIKLTSGASGSGGSGPGGLLGQ